MKKHTLKKRKPSKEPDIVNTDLQALEDSLKKVRDEEQDLRTKIGKIKQKSRWPFAASLIGKFYKLDTNSISYNENIYFKVLASSVSDGTSCDIVLECLSVKITGTGKDSWLDFGIDKRVYFDYVKNREISKVEFESAVMGCIEKIVGWVNA